MKAIVVEDEQLAAERLIELVKSIDATIEIVGQLDTIADTVHYLKTESAPDIIFLDIQLADGRSFEIFEKTSIDSPIIFTTAYDQFTLKAFKLNSIDYLLEPVQKEDLRVALEKLKKLNRKGLNSDELGVLKEIIKTKGQPYKQRLVMAEFARIKEMQRQPFRVKEFFDQLNAIGCIPTSLGHWEMTGDKGQVEKAIK